VKKKKKRKEKGGPMERSAIYLYEEGVGPRYLLPFAACCLCVARSIAGKPGQRRKSVVRVPIVICTTGTTGTIAQEWLNGGVQGARWTKKINK
jgi:hypothetical protein